MRQEGCPGCPHRIEIKRFWEFVTIWAGDCLTGEQLCPNGLGVLADSKLNVCQELALAIKGFYLKIKTQSKRILGCISGIAASRSRKASASLCSACVRLHLEHSPQFWAPSMRKMLISPKFSRRPLQWRGLEHQPSEERLRELDWEKRWLWGHLTGACPYLWVGYGEDGDQWCVAEE